MYRGILGLIGHVKGAKQNPEKVLYDKDPLNYL